MLGNNKCAQAGGIPNIKNLTRVFGLSELDQVLMSTFKGIGAAQDAVRMQRVVSFYEKLPRGAAPPVQPRGLLQRYQARYFGDKPSAARKTDFHVAFTSLDGTSTNVRLLQLLPMPLAVYYSWATASITTSISVRVLPVAGKHAFH